MIYCYIRVSTEKQDYDRQTQIFKDKGYIDGVNSTYIEETYTGTRNSRPILDDLLNNKIQKGDTLIVESLTRLSRSGVIRTLDLISKLIQEKKVNVIVIKEGFYLQAGEKPDANTNLLLGIFSVLGQFERDLISERTKEALKSKKINGTKSGRPIGAPRTQKSSKENFIRCLEYMIGDGINKHSQNVATIRMGYPIDTFKRDIKKCYEVFKTKKYSIILKEVREVEKWPL